MRVHELIEKLNQLNDLALPVTLRDNQGDLIEIEDLTVNGAEVIFRKDKEIKNRRSLILS